jgi:hypothetical protein
MAPPTCVAGFKPIARPSLGKTQRSDYTLNAGRVRIASISWAGAMCAR